ncbi:hypothetical protein [Pseudomonas sp. F(2018)]|uniref:hypothetical protein n=1 Tax=Pseudomonas sp. F(2018) TaxID=2502240 RepID=UPI0010F80E0F|nr:hypothetical protein [Pseudomonas sp. F(2018)]
MSNDHNADECKRFAGEREAFEARFKECMSMRKDERGRYKDQTTVTAWFVWQARAPHPAPVVPEKIESIRLWFFRDLSDSQRLGLFSICGWPAHELTTHSAQSLVLRKLLAAAPAQGQQVEHPSLFARLVEQEKEIGGLREELAALKAQQAEQKPVAEFGSDCIFNLRKQPSGERWPVGTKLYTAPTPQPDAGGPVDAVDRAIEWLDCQAMAESEPVDEALRAFSEDSTLDNATALVMAVRAAHDKQSGETSHD